ncbi:hypothetical protein HGP16_21655 [Rhizobium sp. P40RR-XXII]|uniref:hypothetical protein n=1 Tax=unclassified Rhizobium TaxID=2613769 RepID=UPI001456CA04|nr:MULTISPECIES: hypothetical protein [unclassified Rhizobium]NLR87356.1 hypothetical protein [Rhizobium sp. P28RR-XV]NLS19143.1 hypothetical protein [Rhizobium sp. P40RR-XXII]
MYNLEAALIYHWHKKTLSEEEILQMSNPREAVLRTAIGFAIFAAMILGLNLWATPNDERPQVAAVYQAQSVSADKQ